MFTQFFNKINKPSCQLALSVFCFFVIYQNSIIKLVQSWKHDWNSHGILLFIVCVYIFYKKWKIHSEKLDIAFSLSGYILLLGLSTVWLFANLTFVEYVELVSLPIILTTIFISLLGWAQSRVFWFPILLMLLSGPLLGLFIPVLQDITAVAAGLALELTGISNIVDGVLIFVPAGTFEVDRGCSGLNVVTVGAILSLLYAYINRFRLKEVVVLLILGLLVSILSNVIRVYIIVVVGNATKMQHSLVHDHGDLGWVVFLIIMGMFLFFVHHYWPVNELHENSDVYGPLEHKSLDNNKKIARNYLFGTALLILFISIGPLVLLYTDIQPNMVDTAEKPAYKMIGSWQAIEDDDILWKPVYKAGKGDYQHFQTFVNNEQDKVYFEIRYFSLQRVGNEAINATNSVYDQNAWTRVWIKPYSTNNIEALDEVEETLIRGKNNQEMLVWRWYFTNGRKTGNLYRAKLYNLFGVLMGKPEIASYIIATTVSDTYSDSRNELSAFIKAANNIVYMQ